MAGQMRENAARNAMRNYGFDELIINEVINESLEIYDGSVDAWSFIEEDGYNMLLNQCLDKQEERNRPMEQEEDEVMDQEEDGSEDDEDDSTDDEDYSTDDEDDDEDEDDDDDDDDDDST